MAAKEKVEIPEDSTDDTKQLCNDIHALCVSQPLEKTWFQEDFLDLGIIPGGNLNKLGQCLHKLCVSGLLKIHKVQERTCWKVITRESAAKYGKLNEEEVMVYSYIESSGQEGIWERQIRTRSNLHEAVIKRCLKSLESKRLIKQFKNAKQPRTKFYILFDLQPAESTSGGLFYTDGELDLEYVHLVGLWARDYIHRKSWYEDRPKTSKKLQNKEDVEAARTEAFQGPRKVGNKWLPFPPGYTGYPTVPQITKALNDSSVSTVKVIESEVEKLLDLLCWDGYIEKTRNGDYKSIPSAHLRSEDDLGSSSLTESPCGRCPVFDFCDDSGPVNARTCPYFQDWLG